MVYMKFRYRGGATGFVSRRVGRIVRRSVPDDQLGTCVVIAFVLAVLAGSPILILVVIGLIIQILPVLVLLVFLVSGGIAAYFLIKNRYPQMFVSWFFLKENEPDATVLPFDEIKNRLKEFIAEF